MYRFKNTVSLLNGAAPSTKFLVLGGLAGSAGAIMLGAQKALEAIEHLPVLGPIITLTGHTGCVLLAAAACSVITATVLHVVTPDSARIRHSVRQALCNPSCGNPLGLQDGELLPPVKCLQDAPGFFRVIISVRGCTQERIAAVSSSVSSALTKRFREFAVVRTEPGLSGNDVTFYIENVESDRRLTFDSVEQMIPAGPTKLAVQKGDGIDLTTSGSMLVAGKTRSGKTTGIVALLLQVLLAIRENGNGEVVIIDPKNAELGQLPGVVVPDCDGEVATILNAVKDFWDKTIRRQRLLSEKSRRAGDAVKWFDAGLSPCFLVIDEYVALRGMFPAKPGKGNDYCLATFDALIKRLVTMGASAGCFVIISIAEASVESGGLPAMLRSAMSTKILFRPTLPEARLMWDSEKLKDLVADRTYNAGDAWFSSTDGVHDNVSFVRFPQMNFPIYRELGRLLAECRPGESGWPRLPPCETEAGDGAGLVPKPLKNAVAGGL